MFLQRLPKILPLLIGFWILAGPVLADTTDAVTSPYGLPRGAQIGPDGFATILEAPPVPYPDEPPPPHPNQI